MDDQGDVGEVESVDEHADRLGRHVQGLLGPRGAIGQPGPGYVEGDAPVTAG